LDLLGAPPEEAYIPCRAPTLELLDPALSEITDGGEVSFLQRVNEYADRLQRSLDAEFAEDLAHAD
jgi:hypothetical protein